MTDQDPKTGKFVKGNKANPGGRPRSDLSLVALIDEAVTDDDWKFIIKAQLVKARRGDHKSIEWLSNRRFGMPTQTTDNTHRGKVELVFDWDSDADNIQS